MSRSRDNEGPRGPRSPQSEAKANAGEVRTKRIRSGHGAASALDQLKALERQYRWLEDARVARD